MDEVEALIDRLLADCDLSSEFGRTRAYRLCLRHAEANLADSHQCNLFLYRAAQRLDQPAMALPVVHNRVPLPDDAKLMLYDHEEDGLLLVGNPGGLRYFGRLCAELAESRLPGENVVLDEGYAPLVGDSYGLTLFCEDEEWFQAAEEDRQDELVEAWEAELSGRIITAEEVVAVQFVGPLAAHLPLSPQRLYRVLALEPLGSADGIVRKVSAGDGQRVRVFCLRDDDGQPLRLGLDLDDPDVAFYYAWHVEQLRATVDDDLGGPR